METPQGILTAERLRELLHYDPTSGEFTWKITRNSRLRSGMRAGSVRPSGYVNLGVQGKLYLAHRLAWLYMRGVWPGEIDHINRTKSDNRFANLREATRAENCQNTLTSTRNTSGFRGVCFDKVKCRWEAKIWSDGRKKWLGYFPTAAEAARAYASAASKHHTHNPAAE